MQTIRRKARRTTYTVVDNEIIAAGLSFEALGLLLWLLSLDDNAEVTRKDVEERGGIGSDKARRIVGELIQAGYMQIETVRSQSGGTLAGRRYLVSEEPIKPRSVKTEVRKTPTSVKSARRSRQSVKPTEVPSQPTSVKPALRQDPLFIGFKSVNVKDLGITKDVIPSGAHDAPEPKPESDGLWEAFCAAFDLPADGGRYKGLAGEFLRDSRKAQATAAEFQQFYRTYRSKWGTFHYTPHGVTRAFLAWRRGRGGVASPAPIAGQPTRVEKWSDYA